MKKLVRIAYLLLATLAFAVPATAGERGTADEAMALAKKAVQHMKEAGKDKALADFNNGVDGWKNRDLYVAVVDNTGTILAHGANKGLVGRDLSGLKDVDGVYIVKGLIEIAESKGEGWLNYKWPNPLTKKIEQKSSYILKDGATMVMVGIYKG